MDSIGIKRFVSKILEVIGNKVANGEWLPIKKGVDGDGNVVQGAVAEGVGTTASGEYSHAEGSGSISSGRHSHAEGNRTMASSIASHAEGYHTTATGLYSHTEGYSTTASGATSHAQGGFNYDDSSFIDMVGVGTQISANNIIKQNAYVIYVGRDSKGRVDISDPKNGYQYIKGIGGYQGQAIGTDTKSIQEVIADLEGRITTLENR